ncbi:MAG: branched-chain amino acid ABC transporter permease [Candidatus Bathyarchaeota archaeon]
MMEYERMEKGVIWSAGLVFLYLASIAFGLNNDDMINISIMAVLCIGFTFTYMMEGFPNLAHTSYAIIGAVTTFYLTRFHRFNPYDTWPFSILVGGLFGVFIFVAIVRPIKRHGGYQDVTLTFSSLAIATVLGGLSWVFSYWSAMGNAPTQSYNLSYLDFWLNGRPGIVYVGMGTCILISVYMYIFLTRTTTGISLRATAEDEGLAEVVGINSFRVHCVSWFISGGLASLAGSIVVIHQGMTPTGSDALLVSVMTGSILGGLDSITGAIIGGVFVGVSQKILSTLLFWLFGLDVLVWAGVYPIVFLVIALFFFPNGVLKGTEIDLKWIRKRLARLRKAQSV